MKNDNKKPATSHSFQPISTKGHDTYPRDGRTLAVKFLRDLLTIENILGLCFNTGLLRRQFSSDSAKGEDKYTGNGENTGYHFELLT